MSLLTPVILFLNLPQLISNALNGPCNLVILCFQRLCALDQEDRQASHPICLVRKLQNSADRNDSS